MGLKKVSIWLLFAFGFMMSLSMAFFTNHTEVYFEGESLSETTVGLYFSIAAIGTIIGPYLMPFLRHHLKVYKVLAYAALASALTVFLFDVTIRLSIVEYNMLAYMLFYSIFSVTCNVFVTAMADPKNRGLIVSIYTMFNYIAWTVAPFIAPNERNTLPGLTILAFFMVALAAFIYFTKFGLKDEMALEQITTEEADDLEPKGKDMLLMPYTLLLALPLIALACFISGIWDEGVTDTLMLLGVHNHEDVFERDTWVSAFSIGGLILPILGKITDKIGALKSYLYLNIGFAVIAGITLLIPFAGYTGTVFFIIFSVYMAWMGILYLVYLGHVYSGKKLAANVAGAEILYAIGAVAGPFLFGKMLTDFGDKGYLSAIFIPVVLLAIASFYSVVKHRSTPMHI